MDSELKTKLIHAESDDDSSLSGSLLDKLEVKPQERYKFLRSIGFGGMKSVLLVYDRDTRREIAMAFMPDFRTRPQRDLERFVGEAMLTARLEHPNIVPVHDIGVDGNGSPFFTMKYLRGQSLAVVLKRLKKGDREFVARYTQLRLLQIFVRICNAIDFAHSQGYCHLDLKPENVNIGNFGEVLVIDWGLAMPLETAAKPSGGKRHSRGTPGFMAPEHVHPDGGFSGVKSDIYSLGGILYSILALSAPLSGLPVEEVLRRTAAGQLAAPSAAAVPGREVPPALDAVCFKAMSLNPDARYESVADLRDDIYAYMGGYAAKAENASIVRHVELFFNRNMQIFLVVVITFLVALLCFVLYGHWTD